MRSWWIGSMALAVAACAASSADADIRGSLDPPSASFSGRPGDCFDDPLIASLWSPPQPTDVLLLLDVSGSGRNVPVELQAEASALEDDLAALLGDVAIGVAWHQDREIGLVTACGYPGTYGQPGDVPWRLQSAIGSGLPLELVLRGVPEPGGGGDTPESQSWALHQCVHDPAVGWRPGARRVVVLLTDSLPHDCDPGGCVGAPVFSTGPEPGADGTLLTADDLPILDVVDDLAANGTALLMADTSGGSVLPGSSVNQIFVWDCWARRTGGFAIGMRPPRLGEPGEDVREVVVRMIRRWLGECESVAVVPDAGRVPWIGRLTRPYPRTLVTPPVFFDFDARICIPPGEPDGVQAFDLTLDCSADGLATHHVTVDVRSCGCSGAAPSLVAGTLSVACWPDAAAARAAALAATSVLAPGCSTAPTLTTTVSGDCHAVVIVTSHHDCGDDSVSYDTVIDGAPPAWTGVPADATAECDAVPPPAAPTPIDACDPAPESSFRETRIDGDCPGRWTLHREWAAHDACGNASQAVQVIEVRDTVPPLIDGDAVVEHCLWPPNHRMVRFTKADFAPRVHDACSEPVTWRLAGCSSDQDEDRLGDGATHGDCVVAPDGESVLVRAERTGLDPRGRTYRVTITATDACGNQSMPAIAGFVHVAHDEGDATTRCR